MQGDVTRDDATVRDARSNSLIGLDAAAAPPERVPSVPTKPFEILVWVIRPPKKVAGPGRKTKLQKQEPMSFGPLQLDTSVLWDSFLQSLAGEVESGPPNLAISSLEWRFMKPANSPWMPLRSATAYTSFIKRMASARTPNVIVRMDPPKAPTTAVLVCIFRYTSSTQTDVTLSHGQLPVCQAHPNLPLMSMKGLMMTVSPVERRYDLLHHSFSHQLILTRKPRFDDELEDIVHEIDAKYHVGLCDMHPDQQCFHYRPADQHFFLDRPKKLVWAAHIVSPCHCL